jgi:hypothetical protein
MEKNMKIKVKNKELFKARCSLGHIFKDWRSTPYCPKCGNAGRFLTKNQE